MIGTNAVSIETNIPLQEGGRILCRGTHVYLGDDMPDPGLVLAGTKCGDGLVSDLFRLDWTEPCLSLSAPKSFLTAYPGYIVTWRAVCIQRSSAEPIKGVMTLTSG